MGQKNLKNYRRALRRTAREEQDNIISRYMSQNWDKVIFSAVTIIRSFPLKERFGIAWTILFKPQRKKKSKTVKAADSAEPDKEVLKSIPADVQKKAGA